MFFRLPVVRFFNRVINRATVTVALVLLQIGWLLWAFFSLTAGKVWVNAGLNVLSLFITLYLVRKALPTWQTPKGSLRRVVRWMLAKLTKMPCAVSGRR